jgi:hypothetical protein
MASSEKQPGARPLFRQLALGIAIVLFILGPIFHFTAPEAGYFPLVICLIVGFIMVGVGATGYWPPRSK